MSADFDAPPTTAQAWQSYRHLADNAIDVVFEANLDTVIQWCSPSVVDVLGWQPEQIVGMSAPELVHPEDLPDVIQMAMEITQHAQRVRSPSCRMLMADGRYKALQLRGRPALDGDDNVVGHIISMQDASDRDAALRALSVDRKSTRLNSSHTDISRMPSSA